MEDEIQDKMSEKDNFWTDELRIKFADFCMSKPRDMLIDLLIQNFKLKFSKPKYPEGIMSFRDNDKSYIYPLSKNGKYCFDNNTLESMLGRNNLQIYSVKNSSNETLTIGDETNYGKIYSFEIVNDEIAVHTERKQPPSYINSVHPKERTFKTEDGFIVSEGFWAIDRKDFRMAFYESVSLFFKADYVFFKYREGADKYVEENKPRFTKKEIEEAVIPKHNIASCISIPDTLLIIDKEKLFNGK